MAAAARCKACSRDFPLVELLVAIALVWCSLLAP